MDRHLVTLFSAFGTGPQVPDWVHLVPAGTFAGLDGRGPYTLADAASVIALSMGAGAKLPVDENHAIDLAAPKGEPSPARGWIVALEARADGIWGRVEWTETGKALLADRAYRGLSPALAIAKAGGRVLAVLRASLTNNPNLADLTTLHHRSQSTMDIAALRQTLGLATDASEDAILAAIRANATAVSTHAAERTAITTALGLAESAAGTEIVTALQARATGDQETAALRTTVVELQTSLARLQQDGARKEAERVIDDAIKGGKVGLVPLREHYITRHMAEPAAVAKEIAAMPDLHSGGLRQIPKEAGGTGSAVLGADAEHVCALMGVDPAEFAKTAAAMQKELL
ncbi:phage protease [Azorhizobium caulinodans]|uniref:phage protease n=1 Tax=Azorhizobium caulinodans TaxID=7 RepID=UPI002FBED3BA